MPKLAILAPGSRGMLGTRIYPGWPIFWHYLGGELPIMAPGEPIMTRVFLGLCTNQCWVVTQFGQLERRTDQLVLIIEQELGLILALILELEPKLGLKPDPVLEPKLQYKFLKIILGGGGGNKVGIGG